METVCQVAFKLMTADEARRAEAILREYLLRTCDQVIFQRAGSSPLTIIAFVPHPFRMRKFLKMLKPEDVASRNDHEWTFNLTENVKNLFNQTGLFFTGPRHIFYGFTDPKFMKQGNEVAYLITHERFLTLYIPDSDKAQLASQGIDLDSPEEA
jgi:hypothetical protein